MRKWLVTTPLYKLPGKSYYEPPEFCIDVVMVEAPSKNKARGRSIKTFKKHYPRGYHTYAIGHDENPFIGLHVRELNDKEEVNAFSAFS